MVSYGSSQLLRRNLVRTAAGLSDALVVVVDNPSTGAEREDLLELCRTHGWEAVLPAENLGFGDGMNRGVARALSCGGTRLVLLNPDLEIAAEDVARLLGAGFVQRSRPGGAAVPSGPTAARGRPAPTSTSRTGGCGRSRTATRCGRAVDSSG